MCVGYGVFVVPQQWWMWKWKRLEIKMVGRMLAMGLDLKKCQPFD